MYYLQGRRYTIITANVATAAAPVAAAAAAALGGNV